MHNPRFSKFPRERPRPWTPEEDQALLNLVRYTGRKDWTRIALQFPGRTGKHCRQRYSYHLEHEYKKGGWTPEEDKVIVELQAKLGNSWSKIAKSLPGRSDNAVKNRWYCALLRQQDMAKDEPYSDAGGDVADHSSCLDHKPSESGNSSDPSAAKSWTWEEDKVLLESVTAGGQTDWQSIAKNFQGRTGEQCQQRHSYHVDHEYKKGCWTREEDQVIIAMQAKYGNSWTKIAKCLPGRSDNSVKNRWYCALLRRRTCREEPQSSEHMDRPEAAAKDDHHHDLGAGFDAAATGKRTAVMACEQSCEQSTVPAVRSPEVPVSEVDAGNDWKRQRLCVATEDAMSGGQEWQATPSCADDSFEEQDIEMPFSPTLYARHCTLLRSLFSAQQAAAHSEAPAAGAEEAAATGLAASTPQGGFPFGMSFAFTQSARNMLFSQSSASMSFSQSARWSLSEIPLDTPPPPVSPSRAAAATAAAAAAACATAPADLRGAFLASAQSSCSELRWDASQAFDLAGAAGWHAAAGGGGSSSGGGDDGAALATSGGESPSLLREIRRRNSWSLWSIEDECRRVAMVAANAPAAAPLPERPAHAARGVSSGDIGAALLALSADDMPAFCPAHMSLSSLFPDAAAAVAFAAGFAPAPVVKTVSFPACGDDFKPAPPAAPAVVAADNAPPPAQCHATGGGGGDFAPPAEVRMASSWEHMLGLTNDQPVSRQPAGRRLSPTAAAGGAGAHL